MSASVFDPCGRISLVYGLFLLMGCTPELAAAKLSNCSHPLVPEHGGFRCEPSPCRGFSQKTAIRIFCEPGYHTLVKKPSRCQHGRWVPQIPTCIPNKGSPLNSDSSQADSVPGMATTAVGVSIFLLTTTACLVVKSRLFPCQSRSRRRSSDQLDLMVDGLPVSLPSYEEAVYGSWGGRISALAPPGPTQLLLSQPLLTGQSPDHPPPPPYEEEAATPTRRDGPKDT